MSSDIFFLLVIKGCDYNNSIITSFKCNKFPRDTHCPNKETTALSYMESYRFFKQAIKLERDYAFDPYKDVKFNSIVTDVSGPLNKYVN